MVQSRAGNEKLVICIPDEMEPWAIASTTLLNMKASWREVIGV